MEEVAKFVSILLVLVIIMLVVFGEFFVAKRIDSERKARENSHAHMGHEVKSTMYFYTGNPNIDDRIRDVVER